MFEGNCESGGTEDCLRAVVSLGPSIEIEKCTGTNGENNPHTIPAL
ncbi:MAG: hypothetical protein Q4G09_05810 [Clostridia bacterium]|nr:hypothetical protein [Clostridia bacterium]